MRDQYASPIRKQKWGFTPNYTVWTFHGESDQRARAEVIRRRTDEHGTEIEDMVQDPRRPLPRPRCRPPPWCSRRSVVNVVNERLPSDMNYTWRG